MATSSPPIVTVPSVSTSSLPFGRIAVASTVSRDGTSASMQMAIGPSRWRATRHSNGLPEQCATQSGRQIIDRHHMVFPLEHGLHKWRPTRHRNALSPGRHPSHIFGPCGEFYSTNGKYHHIPRPFRDLSLLLSTCGPQHNPPILAGVAATISPPSSRRRYYVSQLSQHPQRIQNQHQLILIQHHPLKPVSFIALKLWRQRKAVLPFYVRQAHNLFNANRTMGVAFEYNTVLISRPDKWATSESRWARSTGW